MMVRMHLMALIVVAAVVGAVASARIPPQPPSYLVARAPAELGPAIQRGDLLIAALQNAVLAELARELDRRGPAGAMSFCHIDVGGAAMRTAREEGIAIGRTSARLRNPTNAPRAWAAPFVAKHTGVRAAGLDGYVVDLDDRVGLLRPIVHGPACAGCHGPADRLSPAVRAHLEDRYPADQAVGFRTGDLRGWFWVELPKH